MKDHIKYTKHVAPPEETQVEIEEASTFDENEGSDIALLEEADDLSKL